MENHFRKLGPLLESICQIKENNKLMLLGYDDFKYDPYKRISDEGGKTASKKPISPTKTEINLVIWI